LAYQIPYSADINISSFNIIYGQENQRAKPFAKDLCVLTDAEDDGSLVPSSGVAGLFDLNQNEVLYAKNIFKTVHPASLTKVMTAIVALKYGNPSQILTATKAITITESGAQLAGLKVGDKMTLDQALRILLLFSGNDVAMLIAENIGGTVNRFLDLMNEEAKRIGATGTHFCNPHGLTEANHYTTVYDMYLIFREAMKYETFLEIISMTNYKTIYHDKNGAEKVFQKSTTNLYVRGDKKPPLNVNVLGGKTGTTNAAGHCLILLSKDEKGNSYISVILQSTTSDDLYKDMNNLLEKIHN
jgi:D-alanyl-D-alanine carboxypeptidase